MALTRFRRTLKYARLGVRMLTHTLHMPPAMSEIYGGPRPDWLRDLLDYLPCLQSLIVSKLQFFDHSAMTALRGSVRYGPSAEPYNVRLLLADREPNTTSQGLAETLLRFEELVYLDLSDTRSARDNGVLACLSQLQHLQVLKLRGTGLKDTHAEFLANSIGTRVRFLDLRDNFLTDMAVRSLLQACFKPPGSSSIEDESRREDAWSSANDMSPFIKSPPQSLFRQSNLDEVFVNTLTQPLTGRSWVENLPHVGITHLYLTDNQITVEGVASLIASTRLHVLDVGTVDTIRSLNQHTQGLSSPEYEDLPGAEKLIPVLGAAAKDNMTYFRAHHAVVTAETPPKSPSPNIFLSELPGTDPESPVWSKQTPAELSAPHREIHELPSEKEIIFELADTSISRPPEPSSARSKSPRPQRPLMHEDEDSLNAKRGSAFAPEVALPSPVSTVISPASPGGSGAPIPSSMEGPHGQRIQELLNKRPKAYGLPRKDRREDGFIPYLHPSHVPHLETLVLTDVPSHVPVGSPILSSLRRFITSCSNEALLATLQAGSDYSLPPGQSRVRTAQARSRSLFALRRLVLEIVPPSEARDASGRSWKIMKNSTATYKSSTGDSDLENMWSAATDDFSFFETECGIPDYGHGEYFPMAVLNEKVTLMPEDDDPSPSGTPTMSRNHSQRAARSRATSSVLGPHSPNRAPQTKVPTVDLVAELASFRRAKKVEYEELVRHDRHRRRSMGQTNTSPHTFSPERTSPNQHNRSSSHLSPSLSTSTGRSRSSSISMPHLAMAHYVEGHWKGEVKIVKNPTPKGRSGTVDMFGNYFEKGYLYP